MHCNHRDSARPGACAKCWRFGIIMWSLMLVGTIGLAIHKGTFGDPMSVVMLGVPALLILHSIFTKWDGGDR